MHKQDYRQRGIKPAVCFPFDVNIPHCTPRFLANTPYRHIFFKYQKRQWLLRASGQQRRLLTRIPRQRLRILWINLSAPSFGDTLMDLSSRTLLANHDVELFTTANVAPLYQHDPVFQRVLTSYADAQAQSYDLCILDNFGSRSLRTKIRVAPACPFVSLWGHYQASDTHRVLFSFHRMNQLLGLPLTTADCAAQAKPTIGISAHDQEHIDTLNLPAAFTAIALGGEWSFRTYPHWPEVIATLQQQFPQHHFVLIGSANGEHARDQVFAKSPAPSQLIDCVNQFSYNQTAAIIQRATQLVCADGGLLHAGSCFAIPTYGLFAKMPIELYQTPRLHIDGCYTADTLAAVPAETVYTAVASLLHRTRHADQVAT